MKETQELLAGESSNGTRWCTDLLIFRLTSAEQFDASLASSLIADSI